MTIYNKWDIILVPFPFTNLKVTKKRPALIVSPAEFNMDQDYVIAFITSNVGAEYRHGDYHLKDWQSAQLPKASMLRMKFATISKSIVVKRLGSISAGDQQNISKSLSEFFKKN
ncbi:MAG: type II toxin-antitoxin system PemK/MazF family toxin [Calditrichaeota bacterium]|nr:type II toxin-antitoxin system PemK/MazF family toxin [Calditrichota bacterium]